MSVATCGFGVQKCNSEGSEASKELTQGTGEKTQGRLNCWRMDSSWKKKNKIKSLVESLCSCCVSY